MTFPRKAIGYISIIILAVQGLSAAGAPAPKKKKPAPEAKETANFSPVELLVQEQINDQVITGAVH
jgi:Na+-transporting methylmalonyl-CoA/oxaloacetate decarboxylase gamma subunit